MPTQTEGQHLGDWLKWENVQGRFSREEKTLLAGSGADRIVGSGTVLGKVVGTFAAPTYSGTGNGTMSTPKARPGLVAGTYKARCIHGGGPGAGIFSVVDPNGVFLGLAYVDSLFTGAGLSFTISDGSTDFVAGDEFSAVATAGSGKLVALVLAGVDGSQVTDSVAVLDTTAPDGVDAALAVLERDALVDYARLVYPAGASGPQKAAIQLELQAKRIFGRTGMTEHADLTYPIP